eukprot:3684084-Rhodomonas_salina.1
MRAVSRRPKSASTLVRPQPALSANHIAVAAIAHGMHGSVSICVRSCPRSGTDQVFPRANMHSNPAGKLLSHEKV